MWPHRLGYPVGPWPAIAVDNCAQCNVPEPGSSIEAHLTIRIAADAQVRDPAGPGTLLDFRGLA
jgi:hypothetical protein